MGGGSKYKKFREILRIHLEEKELPGTTNLAMCSDDLYGRLGFASKPCSHCGIVKSPTKWEYG